MASIGKVVANCINGTAESTLALANLNLDFSLYNVIEPPKDGVGNALSSLRRDEAETGRAHKTARQLNGLFGPLLSPTIVSSLFRLANARSWSSVLRFGYFVVYGNSKWSRSMTFPGSPAGTDIIMSIPRRYRKPSYASAPLLLLA